MYPWIKAINPFDMDAHPHWTLYYKIKWEQLADIVDIHNLKILDFGSGGGWTANYLAKNNEVVAIEPKVPQGRKCENHYTQIEGNFENLKDFEDGSFDIIVCHNVLEYAAENDERIKILKEFSRLLKTGGILSVEKNNGAGRIFSQVVFANDIEKAVSLLEGEIMQGPFGKVVLYEPEDLVKWGENLKIEKVLSNRTFFGLQQNDEIKHEPDWAEKMFEIEMKVADMEPYKSIALFHHVLLRKL
jgi:SAM-dependent methyltransferase